jgi:c-di-GMP-binding flagellar brake protein YcgR
VPLNARDRANRVVVPVDVTVELDDGSAVQAVVRDISTTGLFVVLLTTLEIDAEIKLELRIPSADDLEVTRHLAWARVVRRGEGGYGLVFLDPAHELVEAILGLAAHE